MTIQERIDNLLQQEGEFVCIRPGIVRGITYTPPSAPNKLEAAQLARVLVLVKACQEARNYDQIGTDFPHPSADALENALKEMESHGDVAPYVCDPTKF